MANYFTERRADEDIKYFRDRLSAITWDMPDDIHGKIIDELSTTLGGKVFRFNTRIELAKWEIGSLRSNDLTRPFV